MPVAQEVISLGEALKCLTEHRTIDCASRVVKLWDPEPGTDGRYYPSYVPAPGVLGYLRKGMLPEDPNQPETVPVQPEMRNTKRRGRV